MSRNCPPMTSLIIRATWFQCVPILLLVLTHGLTSAQLPITELTSVFPPGGQQGASFEVSVTGANHDDLSKLIFSHPGITATQKVNPPAEFHVHPNPVNNAFTVSIAADVPTGVYESRVVGRFGASNPRAFVVGKLTELRNPGSNTAVATALEVPVGTTVTGHAIANVRDFFRVKTNPGERILFDCWAQRIDSRLNATLVLYDAAGKEITRARNTVGQDPLLDYTATEAGEVIVALYDSLYAGSGEYFYRLNVHRNPHIDFVFPPSGLAGSTQQYTLYGRNLPGGFPAAGVFVDGVQLQALPVNISLPEAGEPTLAIGTQAPPSLVGLDTYEYRLGESNPVRINLSRDPVIAELEANNDETQPNLVGVPCEFTGQFFPERDIDWIQFYAKQGETFTVDVISHRLGFETDPFLVIQRITKNAEGVEQITEIGAVEAPGDRNGRIGTAFDFSTDDPHLLFTTPAEGTYRVKVYDRFGDFRSDPRALYSMQIRRQTQDFRMVAMSKQTKVANANQVLSFAPVLRKGGTTLIEVAAVRSDGFGSDIDVTVEGLPEGVTSKGAVLSNRLASAWLVLEAAENAASWSGPIRIVGKATINDQEVTREARPLTAVWSSGNITTDPTSFRVARDLLLTVMDDEVAPAELRVGDGSVFVTSKGGKIDAPISLTRRGEFKENVTLIATGLLNELKPADVTINGDKSDGVLALHITNANAPPGTYSFYLRSETKAKIVRNPAAVQRALDDQKSVTDAVASIAEELKTVQAARDASVTAATDAANAVTTAKQNKENADTAAKAATEAAAQAAQALNEANTASAAQPDDENLKAAVTAAQQASDEAAAKVQAANEAATSAAAALAEAEEKSKQAEGTKATAEQKFKEVEEKNKRVQAAKAAVDKRVADVQKANPAADVNFALISSPIKLRVEATPINLTAQVPAEGVKQGAAVEIPVVAEKLYGFDEPFELTFEIPGGVAGLTVPNLTIAPGATEGKLQVTAAADATVGSHMVTIRARGKFNNVPIESAQQITLKVDAAAAP